MAQHGAQGTRRVWLPAAFFGAFALVIVGRLIQLQVIEHGRYAAEAHQELLGSETIFARRGSILDRNGGVLATSVDTWDVYVNTRTWKDAATAKKGSEALAKVLGTTADALRSRVAASAAIDVLLKRDVDYEVGTDLIAKNLNGVVLVPNTARVNPEGDAAAAVLGFIGIDNTGLAGIESSYNDVLMGTPGKAIYERDTTGEPIPYGQYIATTPKPGEDVVLTIDRYLQQLAEQALANGMKEHRAKGGSITIMDPSTGEILALATAPGLKFSTLDLANGTTTNFGNVAVTNLYEPGSVMKVVTASAAIDMGVVTPDTTYVDNGVAYIYGIPLKNWSDEVWGTLSMTGVLQHSVNTGAVFMMQAVEARQPGAFQKYLDAFGFGRASGIDLAGEADGIVRRPTDADYSPVDLATQAFGQSISVTPIQMITAVAAAINGGNLLRPHLVKALIPADGKRQEIKPEVVGRAISEQSSATIRKMLYDVVNPAGSTYPGQPRNYTAGGKSGTANVPISNGYDNTQIASFMGFAPANDPKILVLVKLDENQDFMTGTQAASPIFSKLADEALRYMNVPPDAGIYVSKP